MPYKHQSHRPLHTHTHTHTVWAQTQWFKNSTKKNQNTINPITTQPPHTTPPPLPPQTHTVKYSKLNQQKKKKKSKDYNPTHTHTQWFNERVYQNTINSERKRERESKKPDEGAAAPRQIFFVCEAAFFLWVWIVKKNCGRFWGQRLRK